MNVSAFDIAQVFIGEKEIGAGMDNPLIMAMLRTDNKWPEDDEVPWCSAFVNFVCKLLRLPRSKSLLARSWLDVGMGVAELDQAFPGFDVVILQRGSGKQPGPENTTAPGHVGFFAGISPDGTLVEILGGNQGDQVKISRYPVDRVLGVRRLYEEA